MERIIFHVDVNSAFLSWEAVYRLNFLGEKLDLRKIPSAVCGDIKKRHGIILAKSTPAKQYHIQTAETISEALKKCPNLVLVSPHYDLYEVSSKAFLEILHEFTPTIEQYSIDECYMDMSGTQALWGSPVVAAHYIKDKIYRELGFTVNIGISNNKMLAKMAGDFEKPNKVHTLFPEELKQKMWPLSVKDLFFCGRATEKKLRNLGIHTIGEIAQCDIQFMKYHFKKHGEILWLFSHGIDPSALIVEPEDNKGYGNSMTVPFDVCNHDVAHLVLLSLAESVGMRLRRDQKKISVVAVSIKDFALRTKIHQITLFSATNITNEIYLASSRAFEALWDGYTPIRQLGIHTNRVCDESQSRQLDLFCMDRYEKEEKMDRAVDMIRTRYGEKAIYRASYLNAKINPVNGGISKEKHKSGEEVYYE